MTPEIQKLVDEFRDLISTAETTAASAHDRLLDIRYEIEDLANYITNLDEKLDDIIAEIEYNESQELEENDES